MICDTPSSSCGETTHHRDHRKVIIVDWDDTILPSTFVDRWQVETSKDLPLHYQNLLDDICKCAEKFLAEASKYGEVIIITNSDDGWVKYSAERYVPQLLPVIAKYRVVSARTGYERFYPGQPLCWKAAAFAHEVNERYESVKNLVETDDDFNSRSSCGSMEGTDVSSVSSSEEESSMEMDVVEDRLDNDKNTNNVRVRGLPEKREIISFGDSLEERTAVRIVAGQLDAVPKSVMFVSNPDPLQIIGQLHMLTKHMKFVCDNRKSLDLEISTEQAQRCADSFMKKKAANKNNGSLHHLHNYQHKVVTSTSN